MLLELDAALLCANGSLLRAAGDNGTAALDYSLAELPRLVCGTLVFLLILPLVLFEFSWFPIGTTSAVLLGATLMVLCQVVSQEEVYAVIGHRDHMTTIFLLLGMMLLVQYFEREQLLNKVLRRLLRPSLSFPSYLCRICSLSFVLSALFTNDAVCAIMTPLLLQFWEVQERSHNELEIIVLAIATTANIGSVVTIFGNPQMAIIAAATSTPPFTASRLDLRRSILYLGPPALIAFFMNIGFLLLLFHIKSQEFGKSKLRSEASRSDQEMGLTNSLHSMDKNNMNHVTDNGNGHADTMYDGIFNDSRITICSPPLETIPEDEVLDIVSTSTHSVSVQEDSEMRDSSVDDTEQDSNSSDDSDNETTPTKRSDRLNPLLDMDYQLTSIDLEYKPSALHSQSKNFSDTRKVNSSSQLIEGRKVAGSGKPEDYGVVISEKAGIFLRRSSLSVVDFLSTCTLNNPDLIGQETAGSIETLFSPSDSIPFQMLLCLVTLLVIALFLGSTPQVPFDLGLVPMGASIIVIAADAIFNRRNAVIIMKRVDWSIVMMFFGIFVWMHGFNATRLPRWCWHNLGLSSVGKHVSAAQLAIFSVFVIVGSNVFSNVPLALIVLEQLVPCQDQFGLVIMLAWIATIAGNLTLFGSVANLIVAQKAQESVDYHLTFWTYLRYGLPSTLITLTTGILLIYGLLHLGP